MLESMMELLNRFCILSRPILENYILCRIRRQLHHGISCNHRPLKCLSVFVWLNYRLNYTVKTPTFCGCRFLFKRLGAGHSFNWLGQTANLLIPAVEWCACLSLNWCLHMDLTQSRRVVPGGCCRATGARLWRGGPLHCCFITANLLHK